MSDDAELDVFRTNINCAIVLEHVGNGWQLDPKESTRSALKYRRREGEILIVNHGGKGWWDPLSQARGDVFLLVQHLDPALNFGQVRQVLRRLVGMAPRGPTLTAERRTNRDTKPILGRWAQRPRLRPGSAAWTYVFGARALPPPVLLAAAAEDAVRAGPHGSAWFAYRAAGTVTHVEIRGPDYRGALTGGRKTLFRFGSSGPGFRRVVIAEAPIDALSVAALEGMPAGTLYAATGGGMGPRAFSV